MKPRAEVDQGTLALMVLKTLDVLGSLHGSGIARRLEQIRWLLLPLEQVGAITSEWGLAEGNRRARFYRLTRLGWKQLHAELQGWQQTADIFARFLAVNAETWLCRC